MVPSDANREAAAECLKASKRARDRRDYTTAHRYAERAVRLHDTADTRSWLDEICSLASSSPKEEQQGSQESPEQTIDGTDGYYTPAQAAEVREFLKFSRTDYYAILNVPKDVEADELKRAYKRMALKFHPDKNQAPGADEAFKVVGAAFACLADPSKRQQYDMFGVNAASGPSTSHQNFRPFQANQDIPMDDLFNMFFQASADEGAFGGFGGQQSQFFYYQFGGGGFPFQGSGVRHRRHAPTGHTHNEEPIRRRREEEEEEQFIARVLQLIPLFIILFLSFLSNLLWQHEERPPDKK